jgi:hypothetical protein
MPHEGVDSRHKTRRVTKTIPISKHEASQQMLGRISNSSCTDLDIFGIRRWAGSCLEISDALGTKELVDTMCSASVS